jgi:hypothetical protein
MGTIHGAKVQTYLRQLHAAVDPCFPETLKLQTSNLNGEGFGHPASITDYQ